MIIIFKKSFDKSKLKLNLKIKEKLTEKLLLFEINKFDKLLNNHELKWKYLWFR